MKILFVQKVKALVGSEKYFLELLPELEKRGHETTFVCIYSKVDKEKTLPFIAAFKERNLKIEVLEIPSDKYILKCVRFVRKVLKTQEFDLVHSHLIHADLWCALLKKFGQMKCPLVSTKHGYDEAYISKHGFSAAHLTPNRYFKICRFSEKYIDRSFAVSDGLKHLFIDAGICKKECIETIHHGFDLPEVENKKSEDYRFAPQQLIILGRIIPFKGHQYLMEALPVVKRQFPAFKLLVIGHGDEDLIASLKKFAKENELTQNIDFLCYQSNIYDYLVNSDIMIVPSIAEGFGLIFLEALNSKIPIIGFDVPATNEILIQEQTGILIPPYDTEKLGLEIVKLLENPTLANTYAQAGYKRLKEHFSLDRMTSATIQFYQQAVLLNAHKGKKE